MVRQTFKIVKKVLAKINPDQVPIITADQPVYALGKQVQWHYPELYGEDKLLMVMGGLHIEMASLSLVGDWLEGSGWCDAIAKAGITTSGRAESILTGRKVKRSRYAAQVSLAGLYSLLTEAFEKLSTISFELWIQQQRTAYTQFNYCFTAMELQAIVLLLVKSFRMGNFNMFVSDLEQVIPWMFALDHTHYSRWLPIFLSDMKMLPHRHPEVYTEFCKGFFAFQKTRRPFSSMATDQAHEQNIKIIKGNGGSIGILDNPSALMKWMVCEPLLAELLERFGEEKDDDEKNHHEDTPVFEKNYNEHVSEFIEVIKDFGNPFLVEEGILMNLSTKTLLDAEARASVRKAKQMGIESSKCYIQNCLTIGRDSIYKTIPKNNLCLFREKKILATQKGRLETVMLKEECKMFASLYVASQHRDGDLYDFFRHENHAYPPAISEYGKLRKTNKSGYLKCLEEYSAPSLTTPEGITGKILDGGAIAHIFHPVNSKTFKEYSEIEF